MINYSCTGETCTNKLKDIPKETHDSSIISDGRKFYNSKRILSKLHSLMNCVHNHHMFFDAGSQEKYEDPLHD